MAGPWEKFQGTETQSTTEGPWTKFSSEPSPTAMAADAGSVMPVPSNQTPQEEPFQTNPLKAIAQGITSGYTYNFADNIGEALGDTGVKERYDISKREQPLAYAFGNLGGALLSPNPIGKWKALKDAGTLIKTAIAGGRFVTETGLSALGESEKEGLAKLEDVKETFQNPLVLGAGLLSTSIPGLLQLSKVKGNVIAKNGKQSYQLGKGMQEALGSEEGQAAVTSAVNNFETEALSRVDGTLKSLSPVMDEIANANAGTKVDVKKGLSKFYDWFKGLNPERMTQAEKDAYGKMSEFMETAEPELLKNAGTVLDKTGLLLSKAGSEASDFRAAWDFKRKLGEFVYDPKNGVSRLLNEAPGYKAKLEGLYANTAEALSSADKTSTFRDLSKTYSALYKTYDAVDALGDSLAKGSDKLNRSFNKRAGAIDKAFSEIPQAFRSKVSDLESLFKVEMPQVYNAYNIAEKIAGKSPASNTLLGQLGNVVTRIPVVGEGSRLQLLNRLGQEQAGFVKPILSQGPVETGIQTGRGLATAFTPDSEQ